MAIWFTSDVHIGHGLVAELRGFGSTDDHDACLAERWDRVVRPDDQVWVLGDLAVSSPARALQWVRERPGLKHLISGNHDQCHPMHRNSHKHLRTYLEAFESVQPFARRRADGRTVLLSHFPYTVDRGETRYGQYRLPDRGEWLLHGHLHAEERRTSAREIHVGVDAWELGPVSWDDLLRIILSED